MILIFHFRVPPGIAQLAEALVTLKRIQEFLLLDERSTNKTIQQYLSENYPDLNANGGGIKLDKYKIIDTIHQQQTSANTDSPGGIELTNVTARWSKNGEQTLSQVNLSVQPRKLVAVIGPVGSGKSSLIHAILGELPVQLGSIKVSGNLSYAAQEPWIFSATIQTNILFGQEMESARYAEVVRKCALERDFDQFPQGDQTIVGERGLLLSGGQKARISLARACYRKAAIYLLDDPLSAVDSKVGKHLFDQCLRDLLGDRIVVLVTHQMQYLQYVDEIVIFNQGKVEAIGSYENLRESGLDFAKLLANPVNAEDLADTTGGPQLNRLRSIKKEPTTISSGSHQEEAKKDGSVPPVGTENSMQVKETRSKGSISLSVYKKYFKAAGGYYIFYVLLIGFVLSQFFASAGDYFLTYWYP